MPDSRDLCLVADVKTLMQKSGANAAAQDSLIQTLITRASIKIMQDYGREFVPGGPNSETFTGATRTFEYVNGDQLYDEEFIDLYPYDLSKAVVPTILVDTDTPTPTPLLTTDYRLWPQPPQLGVFMAVRIRAGAATQSTNWRKRQVTVTGNWGFPSIPLNVNQACAETVIHWITSYPGARRADQVDSAMPGITPRSYPMSAVDLLRFYERQAI